MPEKRSNKRKPRILINSREAAQLIREGMSDEVLMDRYGLSAHGVESLYEKLVRAGKIEQAELTQRLLESQRTQDVVIEEHPDMSPPAARIKARDAVRNIRSGMSDEALMQKYDLSARGLSSLFRKLTACGEILQSELNERKRAAGSAEEAFISDTDYSPNEYADEPDGEPETKGKRIKGFVRRHKVLFAGVTGGLCGMLLMLIVLMISTGYGVPLKKAGGEHLSQEERSDYALIRKAQHVIRVLRTIISQHDPDDQVPAETCDQSPECRKCMAGCADFPGDTPEEIRASIANCRRRCLAKHDGLIKGIRQRYYGR